MAGERVRLHYLAISQTTESQFPISLTCENRKQRKQLCLRTKLSKWTSLYFHVEASLIDHLFPEIKAKPCHISYGDNETEHWKQFIVEFVSI